jgi:S-methylmethionine-dependent homocysteine/selenocysteine methylase
MKRLETCILEKPIICDVATYAPAFLASGARIIGGCCGTTLAHIAAMAALV